MTSSPSSPVRRGIWCHLGEPVATGVAARAGADWLCLDSQHGLFDRAAVAAVLADAREGWPPIAVRVSELDAAEIGYALDVGADWVIVPLIETVEQARRAVEFAYYPPLGRRSMGPIAPLWGRPAPTTAEANGRGRVWIMVETAAGLDVVDDLLAVDGVAGVLVGPNDLALTLGLDQDAMLADLSPESPIARIVAAARAAGVAIGAFAGGQERTAAMVAQGVEWIAVTTDSAALDHGARALLGGEAGGRRGY